jgi:NADPH:quinone reductase-like Zn-dependent oxidoreductase
MVMGKPFERFSGISSPVSHHQYSSPVIITLSGPRTEQDAMKSYWIKAEHGKTALELRELPIPQPEKGEIVIRMRAASLNRGELLASIGLHSLDEPRPAGGDGAGEVHAAGEDVTGFKPGDRVMARARGFFSEYVVARADQVFPVPERLTWEQAGAIPTAFITAYEMLVPHGRLKSGEWLLIAGASSGVGVACVQIGRVLGAHTIGTSGSREKLERLKAAGLEVAIQARGAGFADEALKATAGKGVNLAVDLVGGTAFPDCLRALANQGRLAVVGYVDGVLKSEIDLEPVHGKRLQIFGISNTHLTAAERAEATRGFVRDVMPAVADGRITPLIDKVFAFADLPTAKDYVDSNAQLGKIVVRIA